MGEDRCAIMVQISEECWKVDTDGEFANSTAFLCMLASSYSLWVIAEICAHTMRSACHLGNAC